MRQTNRREFIVGTISVTGSFVAGTACKTTDSESQILYEMDKNQGAVVVRKSIFTLTRQSPDIVAMEMAIQQMRALEGDPRAFVVNVPGRNGNPRTLIIPVPQGNSQTAGEWTSVPKDGRSWFRQAKIHWDKCQHGTTHFLSWHRVYLYCFEKLIQLYSKNPEFALPYWNWEKDSRFPELFVPEFSAPGIRNQLWSPGRYGQRPVVPETSVGLERINRTVSLPTFEQFSLDLEGSPHGSVHIYSGGEMGAFMSPLDPIFWLHHCNIDRIWEIWRNRVGPDNDLPQDFNQWRETILDSFWNIRGDTHSDTAKQTLAMTRNYGYKYDNLDLPPALPPPIIPESLSQTPITTANQQNPKNDVTRAQTPTKGLSLQDERFDFISLDLTPTAQRQRNEITFKLSVNNNPELVRALKQAGFDSEPGANLVETGKFSTVSLEVRDVPRPDRQDVVLKVFLHGQAGEVHVSDFYFFGMNSVKKFDFYCEAAYPLRKAVATNSKNPDQPIKILLRLMTIQGEPLPTPVGIKVRLNYIR